MNWGSEGCHAEVCSKVIFGLGLVVWQILGTVLLFSRKGPFSFFSANRFFCCCNFELCAFCAF